MTHGCLVKNSSEKKKYLEKNSEIFLKKVTIEEKFKRIYLQKLAKKISEIKKLDKVL